MMNLYPGIKLGYYFSCIPVSVFLILFPYYNSGTLLGILAGFFWLIADALIWNTVANKKHDKLVKHVLGEECDGETFAKEYAILYRRMPSNRALQILLNCNYAVAQYETGDPGYLLTMAYAADESISDPKLPVLTRIVAITNAVCYSASEGKTEEAGQYLDSAVKIRDASVSNLPGKVIAIIDERIKEVSYDLRFARGEDSEEVFAFFSDRREHGKSNREKAEAAYTLAQIFRKRGDTESYRAALESVAKYPKLRCGKKAQAELAAFSL